MNLWIYADETNFQRKAATAQTAGYGVLLTTAPISSIVVQEALAALEADPDRHKLLHKKQDDATLANHYFHATDDSQNAHSHLCTSIRNHVSGRFTYIFEDASRGMIPDLKLLQRSALRTALVELCFWPEAIELLIEQRDSLTEDSVKTLILDLYREIAKRVFDAPSWPFYCPQVNVQVGTKSSPPLQVVDFLLWSCVRAHSKDEKDSWLTRTNPVIRFAAQAGKEPVFEGTLHLGTNALGTLHPDYPPTTYWEPPQTFSLAAWQHIEEVVTLWSSAPPEAAKVGHIKPILDQAARALSNTSPQEAPECVQSIATAYLCIFDTVPLWANASDSTLWKKLAALKTTAAAVAKMTHQHLPVQMFVNDVVRFRRSATRKRS